MHDMNIASLPEPQPGKAGRHKLAIMAVAALILLAGLTFWLTSDGSTQKDLLAKIEGALQTAGLVPLVDATKHLITPPPPPPPPLPEPSVGKAAPGTPADGDVITGRTPVLPDLSAAARAQNTTDATAKNPVTPIEPPPGVMPQQREDSVIRPDFVHDLANWLVAHYKPAPQGGKGQINASIQAANLRYGMHIRGMERQGKDPAGARAYILRYAFHPTMLDALYGIYADRLVDDVARAALAPDQGKALNEAQLDDLYTAYAAFFADLASALGGVAAMPDLKGRIENIHKANQQTVLLHRQITENVFALDEARENKDGAAIPGIEARIENLNERYRASLQGQSNARAALVSAVRSQGPARRLDDDSLLFIALWIERRLDKQADALDAARKASVLLVDLSRRFEKAGNAPHGAGGRNNEGTRR